MEAVAPHRPGCVNFHFKLRIGTTNGHNLIKNLSLISSPKED